MEPAVPATDPDSAPFWDALSQHRVLLQRCTACGRCRFPPMPSCPWCGALDTAVVEAAGTGEVYSWVTVHRAFGAPFADAVPYTIAAVTLDEGARVLARLDAPVVHAGLAVEARFADHDGWTELRFAPTRP